MELWSPEHKQIWLPVMIAEIILAIIIGIVLRNKSRRVRSIPILLITVAIWVLEIFKQIYALREGEATGAGYDLYSIPLHFCSLFLYYFPMFVIFNVFCKKDHDNFFFRLGNVMSVLTSVSLFMMMVIFPDIVYGGSKLVGEFTFPKFHTVTFHTLCVMAFFLFVTLRLYKPNTKKDILCILFGICSYGIVSGIMANKYKTNWGNLYYVNVDFADALRQQVVEKVGEVLGQTIYVAVCIVLMLIYTLVCYFIYRILDAIFKKIFGEEKDNRGIGSGYNY